MAHRFKVEFEVEVPDDMPPDAAAEWIAFAVGASCQMQPRHPTMNTDMEPIRRSFVVRQIY